MLSSLIVITLTKHLVTKNLNTKAKGRKAGIQNYGTADCEFFEDENGVYNLTFAKDVWEISYLNSQAKERLGYPTQKPLALYEKFIKAFSDKDDIVMDIFAGCGTTLEASQNLGRNWIGCDASSDAGKVIRKRLNSKNIKFREGSLRKLSKDKLLKLNPRDFESEVVTLLGGVVTAYVGDGGVDGRLAIDGTPIQVKKSEK